MNDKADRYLRGLQHAMRTLENNADDLGWVERDMARDAVLKAIQAAPVVHPAGERTASSEGPGLAPSGYGTRPDDKDGASPRPEGAAT